MEKVEENAQVINDNEPKKLSRREKLHAKIRKKMFQEHDIKYKGPLSYRALRIIAWLAIIAGQFVLLNTVGKTILHWSPLGTTAPTILNVFSALSTPLFIVASFGLVLNKKRVVLNFVFIYGAAFLGIGLGINLFYYRYVAGLFVEIGLDKTFLFDIVTNFIEDRIQVNVFADLFAFALFNLFVNHTPKKVFVDKKLIIYRLFSIFPVLYIIASYVIRILSSLYGVNLPFFIYPFIATKSPLIFFVFVMAALWIKNRERLYVSLGATKEEYQRFLSTNRNSLSFSINLSLIILSCIVLEIILVVVLFFVYGVFLPDSRFEYTEVVAAYDAAESLSLIIVIPILFLYSYTRTHKNALIDMTIPIIGIGGCVWVYLEGIYQFITQFING